MQTAKITKKTELTYDVFELTLEAEKEFKFKAGQFITIKIEDGKNPPCYRAYSMSTAPNKNTFGLTIKAVKDGRGSNWMHNLKEGNTVEFVEPMGSMVFLTPQNKEAIFVATGTGFGPLKAIIEDELITKNNKQKMRLIFGLRYEKDIFYTDFLESLAKKFNNFSYELTLSRPENQNYKGNIGRVTNILEKMKINAQTQEFYICGVNDMIKSVTELLEKKGFTKREIHTENYN